MEVAAFLADKARSVTVVGNRQIPFESVLGPEIGRHVMWMHQQKGVKFMMNVQPQRFLLSEDKDLTGVLLSNGSEIDADVVVLGIGVEPSTEYLANDRLLISQ